jgi:hypothetical protein
MEMRGNFLLILGAGLLAFSVGIEGASARVPAAPVVAVPPPVQSCEVHSFATTIQVTGPDGKPKESRVRMCGTVGQSDADWILTLKDAVKKTELNPTMPAVAKEQIIAAVSAEIMRLSTPALNLPGMTDIAKLPKAATAETERPLSRDYGALAPLPTETNVEPPHLLGPGGLIGPVLRLTFRCAVAGDEDRPAVCDEIDKDTIMVVRADEAFPSGLDLRFNRHGDNRADQNLPALKVGQSARLRLPPAVCAGVVRSKVEILALPAGARAGTAPSSVGEYDLRC